MSTSLPFASAYRHGYARIAACTIPIRIADPATNADSVLAVARECDADGVAVALFPELCLSGYSIEDLRQCLYNGLDSAWIDPSTRMAWRADWGARFDALRAEMV